VQVAKGVRPPLDNNSIADPNTSTRFTNLMGEEDQWQMTNTSNSSPLDQLAAFQLVPDFDDLIESCWEQNLRQRPTAEQVLQRLEHIVHSHSM
jgi:hypothetical protein